MEGDPGPGRRVHFETHHGAVHAGEIDRSTFTFLKNVDARSVVALLPLLVAVGIAGYAALSWPGGPQIQYAGFYAALGSGFVTSVRCAVMGPAGLTRPTATAGLLLVTVSLGASLLGLGGLEDIRRNREIPVGLSVQAAGPLTGSSTQTLVMPAPAPGEARDRLRLALTLTDDDPASPTCVHKTVATLTVLTPGVTPGVQRVPAQSEVEFDLGGRRGEVEIEIAVQTREGCALRVAQADGTLFNE
ncbi:hypothetical protein GCM10009639_46910 [Kitasatospora putterlickiae]|uniref:Uncharacterized protein n=1 Tax=Kitasatospora putterlickiae TaxID=221725 RepID=A0ABN1YB11_9ACTN